MAKVFVHTGMHGIHIKAADNSFYPFVIERRERYLSGLGLQPMQAGGEQMSNLQQQLEVGSPHKHLSRFQLLD